MFIFDHRRTNYEFSDIDLSQTYSYADYYSWEFEERVELFYGNVKPIGVSPGTLHQTISGNILGLAYPYFKERKSMDIYSAPFDVRFPTVSLNDEDIYTVLQPDVSIFFDPGKLDERGGIGVPDIVIEILRLAIIEKR